MGMVMTSAPLRLVFTTFPDRETAQSAATALVSEHLAACVHLLPDVTAIYEWEGRIESGAEVKVIIKTTEERHAALLARLTALHPYKVPELVTVAADAAGPYLDWARAACRQA